MSMDGYTCDVVVMTNLIVLYGLESIGVIGPLIHTLLQLKEDMWTVWYVLEIMGVRYM